MFKKKIQYYNIIIKSENSSDIKLSLLKGKPIIEALQEFNSHIQNSTEHITKLYIHNGDKKINVNLQYQIEKDIVVFRN